MRGKEGAHRAAESRTRWLEGPVAAGATRPTPEAGATSLPGSRPLSRGSDPAVTVAGTVQRGRARRHGGWTAE